MFEMFNRVFNTKSNIKETEQKIPQGQIVENNNEGAVVVSVPDGGTYAQQLAFNFDYNSQAELVESYREIAQIPEVKNAIDEVVNDAISYHEDENPISISLADVPKEILVEKTCKKIEEIWDNKIIKLLNLNYDAHLLFEQFYIDGIKAAHIIPTEKKNGGIEKVVVLDAVDIVKIRNEKRDNKTGQIIKIEEYFQYKPNSFLNKKDKSRDTNTTNSYNVGKAVTENTYILPKESVAYATSGMRDFATGLVKGWLHEAVKPATQLATLENSLLVYRLTRAPERRVFYVDVGGLTASKAEQYVENLKNRFRNRMVLDPASGSFKDKRHLMTMQEDFWLPRQNGRGTEVSTLAGGQSLGEIDDVMYFLKKLYKALNVPSSRFEDNGATLAFDRAPELSRDELKFSKYVSKVRKRFNYWLSQILRTELILTKTISEEEWEKLENYIVFNYSQDFYLEEKKRNELFRQRLALASEMGVTDFVGSIYSMDYVKTNILQMTQTEIDDQKKQIEIEDKEKSKDKNDDTNNENDEDVNDDS